MVTARRIPLDGVAKLKSPQCCRDRGMPMSRHLLRHLIRFVTRMAFVTLWAHCFHLVEAVQFTAAEVLMTFSLSVIAGVALVAVCVSRLKARLGAKKDVQTLFSDGK